MALAFVQQVATNTAGFVGTQQSAAMAASTTTGNTIVVCIVTEAAINDITSVTDTASNSYSRLAQTAAGSIGLEFWIARNITGGATFKVTVNDSGFVIGGFVAMELSGIPTTGTVLDGTGTFSASSGASVGGTMSSATTNANDILIYAAAVLSSAATMTIGNIGGAAGVNTSTANGTGSNTRMSTGTQIVSSTGTYSGAATSSVTNTSELGLIVAISDTGIISSVLVIIPYRNVKQSVNRASTF